MKKIVCFLLAVMLIMAGCSNSKAPAATEPAAVNAFEGTMEELSAKILENHRDMIVPMGSRPIDLTNEDNSLTYNTGLENGDKLLDASVTEPMMGQPISLVLVRVKDAADAADVAQELLDKVNGRKWICMEADTRTAAVCGDVVMFFMASSEFAENATTDSVVEAFKAVCGDGVTVVG